MLIGFVDLFATAVLHQRGLIVELNPAMRPFIERSEWLFAFVKAGTLVGAWVVMARYARINVEFVHKACLIGSLAYVAVWTSWFFGALGRV
jgi:hypothetical protein